jgi:acetyl esterase/lipase
MKFRLLSFLFALFLPLVAFAADSDIAAIERDVEYGRAGDVSLKLDVFRPSGAKEGDKLRPAVIYVHGGAWKYGDKAEGVPFLMFLAATGDYVGFTINYRLVDTALWPAQIHDCKAAVRFVRANAKRFGVDPERIGVSGTSAGGHLVNMLGVTGDRPEFEGDSGTPGVSTKVCCVINNCGPTDMPNLGFTDPEDWKIVKQLFGGMPGEKREVYKSASPIYYVEGLGAREQSSQQNSTRSLGEGSGGNASNEDSKPKTRDSELPAFLHLHGTKDPIVNYDSQAVAFHKALKKAGVSSMLIAVIDGGHPAIAPELGFRSRAFLDKYLLDKNVEVSEEAVKVK